MTTDRFTEQLNAATAALLQLTSQHCHHALSLKLQIFNRAVRQKPHDGMDQTAISCLKIINRQGNKLLSATGVIQLLCVDNKVPLWINATVYKRLDKATVIPLFCSRRLSVKVERHNAVKHPSLNIQVPLPPNFDAKNFDNKFDVNWKKVLDD